MEKVISYQGKEYNYNIIKDFLKDSIIEWEGTFGVLLIKNIYKQLCMYENNFSELENDSELCKGLMMNIELVMQSMNSKFNIEMILSKRAEDIIAIIDKFIRINGKKDHFLTIVHNIGDLYKYNYFSFSLAPRIEYVVSPDKKSIVIIIHDNIPGTTPYSINISTEDNIISITEKITIHKKIDNQIICICISDPSDIILYSQNSKIISCSCTSVYHNGNI